MTNRHSYSSIQQFKKCPLSYYLKYIINLEPRDAEANNHHLQFGKAGHAGLEALYGGELHYAKLNFFGGVQERLKEAQGRLLAEYPTQLDPNDRAKTAENGIQMLESYVLRWKEEDLRWRVLSVELLDTSETSPLDVLRLDLVMENLDTGGIYGFDHKITGKSLGPWFWEQFNPNSQITHYINHVQERFGSCEGFIINAISLQWLDEKKSNDANNVKWFALDDPEKPWLRYSHYEERPYRGGPLGKAGPRMCAWGLTVAFERQVFNRTESQIQQERASTAYWIQKIDAAEADRLLLEKSNDEVRERALKQIASYGFNTASCTFCEYRGGDMTGGICRPGYEWPRDRELILLSYRQVCREVIQLQCSTCAGTRIDPVAVEAPLSVDGEAQPIRLLDGGRLYFHVDVYYPVCPICQGSGSIPGPRCALERGHSGACSETRPVENAGGEIVVEVTE